MSVDNHELPRTTSLMWCGRRLNIEVLATVSHQIYGTLYRVRWPNGSVSMLTEDRVFQRTRRTQDENGVRPRERQMAALDRAVKKRSTKKGSYDE